MSIPHSAAIRELLLNAFGEEDFDFFCYDHFREVYRDFAPRMSLPDKTEALLEFVDQHNEIDRLLELIKEANPTAYEKIYLPLAETTTEPVERSTTVAAQSITNTPPMPAPGNNAVFISYSRRDEEFVQQLYSELTQRGISAWYDRKNIRIGQHWPSEIVQGIEGCRIFLLSLSPDATASENVRKELDLAQRYKKQIVPLIWRTTKIPVAMEYQLAGIQWIEFNESPTPEKFDQLTDVLNNILQGASLPTATGNISIVTQSTIPPVEEKAAPIPGRKTLMGLKRRQSVSPLALGGSVISSVVTTFKLEINEQDFVNTELKWLFSAADNFLKVQRNDVPRSQPVSTPIPPEAEVNRGANNSLLSSINEFDMQIWTGQIEGAFKRIQIHLKNLDILLDQEAKKGEDGKGDIYLQNQIRGGRLEIVKILQELAQLMRQAYGVFVSSPDLLSKFLQG